MAESQDFLTIISVICLLQVTPIYARPALIAGVQLQEAALHKENEKKNFTVRVRERYAF